MNAVGELDEWAILQYATEPECARLVTDIIGHPAGMICLEELVERNPTIDEETIKEHLSVLYSLQVIVPHELPEAERTEGNPIRFFAITPAAQSLFEANDLFCADSWRRQYASEEPSERLSELADIPRPVM